MEVLTAEPPGIATSGPAAHPRSPAAAPCPPLGRGPSVQTRSCTCTARDSQGRGTRSRSRSKQALVFVRRPRQPGVGRKRSSTPHKLPLNRSVQLAGPHGRAACDQQQLLQPQRSQRGIVGGGVLRVGAIGQEVLELEAHRVTVIVAAHLQCEACGKIIQAHSGSLQALIMAAVVARSARQAARLATMHAASCHLPAGMWLPIKHPSGALLPSRSSPQPWQSN